MAVGIRVRRYVCVTITLSEGGVCPRGGGCAGMLGRRRAAHLVGRTGPGAAHCIRTAAAVGAVEHEHGQPWEATRHDVVRLGETGVGSGSRREVSRTYPTVETVGLRRGLIAVARLGRRGVAVVILLRRTGAQGNAVVSGEFV